MHRPLIPATALLVLLAAPLLSQTATETEGEAAPAEGSAAPAPPPPEYNGTISGSSSGSSFSADVVCSGFSAGGGVVVQTDPGGNMQDLNGDGVMADITADPSGSIALTLLAGNSQVGLTDTTAVIDGNTLTYAITMSFVGGGSDEVDLTVVCNE
ncbi:hypothetical protein [Oceanibium sediminis]|uniref:hypothetical protein n=1 Tax=Oceanibium sediminis TaxID=2026339 RepID=UPI000DD35124|nr:hypothetical protein [Oceanibium sediminis]